MDSIDLKNHILQANQVVITSHRSPDGDAVGSSLALHQLLLKLGLKSTVIVPDAFPSFLHWMNGSEHILQYDRDTDEANANIDRADVIFALDYNRLARVAEMGNKLKKVPAIKAMIDHHIDPDTSFDFLLSDTKASSTAELVYRFAQQMDWLSHLDQSIAEALYAGIMTDTGSFKFSSTSPETHRIAAHLMELGMVPDKVHSAIFDINSLERLQLIGYALSKKLIVDQDRGVSIIPLSLSEKNRFHYKKGDTEGLVNYGLSVLGTRMAVFLSEELDLTKFSFRSKGDFDVNAIAREYFNGGGHKNAAGGRLDMKIDDALAYLNDVIQNKLEL